MVRVLAEPGTAIVHVLTYAVLVGFVGLLVGGAAEAPAGGMTLGAFIGVLAAFRQLSEGFRPEQAFALPPATELHRTDALVLRTPRPGDRAGLDDTVDDEVVRVNGWTPRHKRATSALFRFPPVAAESGLVVVADAADDCVQGVMSISPLAGEGRRVQVGGWIGPPSRGTGLAGGAFRGTARIAFGHGASEVVAGTSTDNTRMQRALEQAGARRLSGVRAHELPDGSRTASIWFAFQRGEPA